MTRPGPLLRRVAGTTLAIAAIATGAEAQPPGSTSTDVFTRLVWLEGSAQSVWRGIDRGYIGLVAGGAVSRGGPGARTTRLSLIAEGRTAVPQRSVASDLIRLGGTLVYQVTDEGPWVWLGADGFVLPSADDSMVTGEVAAGLRFRLPKWLPERRPTILLEAHRDLWRYDATYARAAIQLDYKFGVQHGAFIEAGQAWSDFLRGESADVGRHGSDLTITYVRQADPATTPTNGWTRSVEPFLRVLWTKGNRDRNLIDAGVRIAWVH